jgi:radical SAM superfamily enzyme
MKDEKYSKALEGCTFVPNASVNQSNMKSQAKLANQSISISHRNTSQFLED